VFLPRPLQRIDLKIFFPILLFGDPEIVTIEAILIPVVDDQGRLARIAVEGDMVGDEAVALSVLRRALPAT
jgi:hypothetical protein